LAHQGTPIQKSYKQLLLLLLLLHMLQSSVVQSHQHCTTTHVYGAALGKSACRERTLQKQKKQVKQHSTPAILPAANPAGSIRSIHPRYL
jgi:hypothetical protein